MISRLALLVLLGLLSTLPACATEQSPPLQGKVTWVYDGDTLEIDTVGKVRLIGIDTPEHENSPRDRFLEQQGIPAAVQRRVAKAARDFNIGTVKGQQVSLKLDKQTHDRFGRLLAYVQLADGRLLNRLLIEQGLAVVYRKFEFTRKEEFLAAESLARRNGKGLWRAAAAGF